MVRRSPARLLAPLALLACIAALFGILSGRSDDGGSASQTTQTSPRGTSSSERPRKRRGPRFYRVKAGDTLASVAERYNTTVDRLLQLNENRDLDPQTLSPGTRIRLRR